MWRNPWLITLWVIGVLVLVAGVVVAASPDLLGGGSEVARWGMTILLAGVVVAALRWQPSERVGERQQPQDHRPQDEAGGPGLPGL